MQTFKPLADGLTAMGLRNAVAPEGQFARSYVLADRHRDLSRLRFAQAWMHTQEGGEIIVSGQKTDGIDAFVKEVAKAIPISGVLPKSHGKVFWLDRAGQIDLFDSWLGLAKPVKNADGFVTSAGTFSSAKIDKGSAILSEHLPTQAAGRVADLGAGWGYLSVKLLERAPTVEAIDLFEADMSALECAKINLPDPRASFHWEDVARLDAPDNQYDWVISNPPFHQTRKSEPQLGQAFIETAARILKPSGQMMMVANRQLPYETTLESKFRSFESVAEANGFKVIVAKNPKRTKRN